MLRVINWNISCMGGNPVRKIDLLRNLIQKQDETMPTVIALQEVTEKTYEILAHDDLFIQHTYSLQHRPPGLLEGRNRGLGCLIAVTGGVEILEDGLIHRTLFPERALKATVRWEGKQFETINFHSLTGVDFKRGKSAHFASLVDHLHCQQQQPIILCCDLNEPKIDHIDPTRIITHDQKGDGGKAAALLLKSSGIHSLSDAYRLWLDQRPQYIEVLRQMQEDETDLLNNPLAVSYKTRTNGKRRYDYVFVSPHWQVKDTAYLYEEGVVQHGSDHAVVITDLEWVD